MSAAIHAECDRRFLRRLACVVLALLPPSASFALTLGAVDIQSSLGQRLRMIVQVNTRPDEQVDATCFRINPYTVAADGLPQLTAATVALERANGGARLLVSSMRPIDDPVVRLSIDIGCGTTLRRDLTLLLDPAPVVDRLAETSAAAVSGEPGGRTPPTAATNGDASTSGGAAVTEGAAPSAGTTAGAQASASGVPGSAAPLRSRGRAGSARGQTPSALQSSESSSAVPPSRPSTAAPLRAPSRRAASSPPPSPPASTPRTGAQRDRLTISAGTPAGDTAATAPLAPHLTLATSLAERSGAPPLPESVLGILRQKQARLRAAPAEEDMPSLEAELAVLQKRTAELRTQIETLTAQMQALNAQSAAAAAPSAAAPPPAAKDAAATPVQSLPPADLSQRYALDGRWLFTGALIVLLALLFAALGVWVRRERAEARRRVGAPERKKSARPASGRRAPTVEDEIADSSATAAAAPGTANALVGTERSQNADSYAFTTSGHGHAASQLGVSDLAQATEKASVFMTLGRPEQAIDVLRDHIDHESKPSPMAWLMLIDLYRKTRRRFEFDETAERFHQTFNVEAPHWDDSPDDDSDEGLAGSPRILAHVRELWPRAEALEYIESLLYDNRGGSRVGFSLSAFRDLLLLHSSLEEYLLQLADHERDASADELLRPDPPSPPPHLRKAWSAAHADHAASPTPQFELDTHLFDSADSSPLERGLPVVAEAIVSRWGKPGAADYLTNPIALSKDDRNSGVSTDTMSDLLMLQHVAAEIEESRSRDLSY